MLFEMWLSIVISFLSWIISLLVSMSSLMNSPMLSMLWLWWSDNFYGSSSNDFMFDMDWEEWMSTANIGVANMYDDENNDDEVYPIEDIGVSNNINSESSSESSSESEEEFDNSELDIFAQLAAEANQEDEVEILEEDEEEISLEIEEEVEEEVETIENNNEEEIDEEQEENNTSIEDTTQSIIDEELETVGGFDEAVAIIDTVWLTNDDMQKLYDETKTLPLIESENSFDAGKLALDDYINKVRSNTAQHDINLNACTKQTYGYKDIEGNKEILILTWNQWKLMQATTMSMDANGNEEEKDIYLMTQTTSAQTMSAILTEQNNALDDYQYILLSESELEDQCWKITYTDENIDQTLVGTLFEWKIMKWELK